ncbi:MAG: biosynthetic-type acetolactate synthase large subunit [Deltaproteobacteria bacterium]|nr:biosynthetic-type acetolactate synthase large subunit [Deltaproteobacteria bacterium]
MTKSIHTSPSALAASPSASYAGEPVTGGQVVVEGILQNGVDVAFGYPGGAVMPLYDDILKYQGSFRHVLVRHEQGAVHAAQAWARVTGKPGVAIGTSGPGATNLITGIMDARLDSTPLVVFGGQVATHLIGNDAFQETDMMGMTNPITKHNFQVRSVHELGLVIHKAFHIARTGRPGPVYIDLPKDIQLGKTRRWDGPRPDFSSCITPRPVDMQAVARAAMLIRSAKRPFLVIGHGGIHAEANDALRVLAKTLNIPMGTTILAKGLADELDPLSVGCVGMHGRRVANYAVVNCDVLIAFGCRFSDRITGETKSFAKGKRIVHVDIDPYEIGKNVPAHVGIVADAREAAEALLQELRGFKGDWDAWTDRIKVLRDICNGCVPNPKYPGMPPKHVMNVLNSVIADDDVITTGVGQHQMFACHYLYRRKPRTFITSGGAGTMGFGLPAAIGAAIAKPWVNVWAIEGDGSLQMTLQELGTLRESGAKVIVVLIDNSFLGMVRQWQELYLGRRYSAVDLSFNPDFARLAEAYGIEALRCEDGKSLKEGLKHARDAAHSVFLHVRVEKESNMLPMIPPGGKVSEFFGYCIEEPGQFFTQAELAKLCDPAEKKEGA